MENKTILELMKSIKDKCENTRRCLECEAKNICENGNCFNEAPREWGVD